MQARRAALDRTVNGDCGVSEKQIMASPSPSASTSQVANCGSGAGGCEFLAGMQLEDPRGLRERPHDEPRRRVAVEDGHLELEACVAMPGTDSVSGHLLQEKFAVEETEAMQADSMKRVAPNVGRSILISVLYKER